MHKKSTCFQATYLKYHTSFFIFCNSRSIVSIKIKSCSKSKWLSTKECLSICIIEITLHVLFHLALGFDARSPTKIDFKVQRTGQWWLETTPAFLTGPGRTMWHFFPMPCLANLWPAWLLVRLIIFMVRHMRAINCVITLLSFQDYFVSEHFLK